MNHASLFSGIGGAEIAAEWMGWENAFHVEINPFGRKILEYWYPNSISYEDITKTDFSEWRGRIDVLTAGFPCQPFSVAGQRKGADDDRYLWPQVVRAVHEIKPAWVVGENVAGILTMVQPGEEAEVGSGEKVTEKEYCYGRNTSSKPSAVTLNEKVTKSGRLLFRLVPSEHHTDGTGCGLLQGGLLQTPRATEIVEDSEKFVKRNGDRKPGCMPNLSSMAAYRADLLPTPMSTEVRHEHRVKELKEAGGQTFHSRKNGETRPNGLMDYMDFHGMLPTPTARDHKNGSKPEDNRTKRKLQQGWTLELNDMATGGLLPTPNASEGEKYTKKYNPNSQMGKGLTAMAMNNMLPTPTASCHNAGTTANRKDGTSRESELNHFIARQVGQTSQLNPPRDDGFPIPMDGITFSKWRQEAIKAYGNAWCVPVAYEIFRAIQQVEDGMP